MDGERYTKENFMMVILYHEYIEHLALKFQKNQKNYKMYQIIFNLLKKMII